MNLPLLDMEPAEYHADPCAQPSLSVSIATKLIHQSPYHAWLAHPKLGAAKTEATKSMDDGTILHAMLLEQPVNVEWLDFDNYRTKAAQNARDEAEFNGSIPKLKKEQRRFEQVIERVQDQLHCLNIGLSGQREGVVQWVERDNEDRAVYCRAKLDVFDSDYPMITDLKFVSDAHPRSATRKIIDYGYDIQAHAYRQAIGRQIPELAGRVGFRFIFVEVDPPNLISVITPNESLITLGAWKWSRAVNLWSQCLHSDRWPAYGESTVSAPAWAVAQEQEDGGMSSE